MFESSVDDVASSDVAALAASLLALTRDAVLGGDLASAQAVVAATQRVVNAMTAIQALGIEAWSRRTREDIAADTAQWGAVNPGRAYPGPRDEHEFMDSELAPLLHVAPRTAQRTYELARTLCAVLPSTWAAMRAGDLEPYRARAIAQEVPLMRPEVCARVERALFPGVLDLPTARVRAATRRAVAAVDPDEVIAREKRARAERFVLVRPGPVPGTSEWVAEQPSDSSAAAWAAIDELAHSYVADGDHRSLDQARADAMIDLILGQATVTTTIDLSLPASTAQGPAMNGDTRCSCGAPPAAPGGPARVALQLPRVGVEVPRVGLIATEALTRLLTNPDTRLRIALHDPDTGVLLAVDSRVYRPDEATARLVRRRDGCCRFPGCATPARRCDLDHVTTFTTGGPTTPPNLITLCRRHHRLKHHGGWRLTMTPLGVATWTNGIGQRYVTRPIDHRHVAA